MTRCSTAMSKKRSTTEIPTTRLNRKAGAAPKVARKPRLSEQAIVEISAAAPVAEPVPVVVDEVLASPPEPPVAPAEPAPFPPSERLTFRQVAPSPTARRPTPGELFRALVERARREWLERTADVRQRLGSRFPLLAAIHRSLSRRV
jgi:hypothetical protein